MVIDLFGRLQLRSRLGNDSGDTEQVGAEYGIEHDVIYVDVLNLVAVEGKRLIECELDTTDLAPVRQDHVVIAVAPDPIGIDGANAPRQTIFAEQHDPLGIVGLVGDDGEPLAADRLVRRR